MKITDKQLKRIIRESISKVNEMYSEPQYSVKDLQNAFIDAGETLSNMTWMAQSLGMNDLCREIEYIRRSLINVESKLNNR